MTYMFGSLPKKDEAYHRSFASVSFTNSVFQRHVKFRACLRPKMR
jgi:hypothetical protein